MSRERFVDPGIWTNEDVCAVSRDARQLFVGCITMADDCGFWTANPWTLKLSIFPTDVDITKEAVGGMLAELVGVDLVRIYGKHLWIPQFFAWQSLKWRSRGKRLPKLVEAGIFQAEFDPQGRVVTCGPNLPDPARPCRDLERGGEGRGVV